MREVIQAGLDEVEQEAAAAAAAAAEVAEVCERELWREKRAQTNPFLSFSDAMLSCEPCTGME